jgi:hypothetical protein
LRARSGTTAAGWSWAPSSSRPRQLLEPHLRPNALIVAENATADYLDYIEDATTPYVSLPLPFRDVRGNELTVFTG